MHFNFIIIPAVACALHPVVEAEAPDRVPFAGPDGNSMTRCECAEVSFQEIARQVDGGASLEQVTRKTGCGTTCTACLPDLRRYLASRS